MKPQAMSLAAAALCAAALASAGCMSRMISEGMGTARGASGKFIERGSARSLSQYQGLTIEPLLLGRGMGSLDRVAALVQRELDKVAGEWGLNGGASPALRLSGEIIHYERAGSVDTVIGPLEEIIVRTTIMDVQTGQIVAEANLIGRARATMSSGDENLSAGVGKALEEFLEKHGVHKAK